MFVRFSKRNGNPNRSYNRGVSVNGTYLIQFGTEIVAYGYLKSDDGNVAEYHIKVLGKEGEERAESIVNYTKRFIGNSQKWEKPSEPNKRRRYKISYTENISSESFRIKRTRK